MKHKPPIAILFLLLLVIIVGGGYWYFSNNPAVRQQVLSDFGLASEAERDGRLTASGFIEMNQINIMAEMGGRVKTIAVGQGDRISAGQPLVNLDTALLDAQSEQVMAQIALAEAQLAHLKAGVPAEQIALAETAVIMAETGQEAAYQTWQDAILLRDNPQVLNAQIDTVRSEIEITKLQMEQATYIRQALELREDLGEEFWKETQEGKKFTFQFPDGGIKRFSFNFKEGEKQQASVAWNLATTDVWQGWVTWENAQQAHQSAQSTLQTLLALRANPIEAESRVIQTEADYQAKIAAVEVTQANLALAQTGPTLEQIDLLKSQVAQAETRLTSLATQREKLILTSPIAGVVIEDVTHQGEVAMPGATLLTVANPERVTLTVFVPESDYGRLRQNQAVEVYVDSYPEQPFMGTITYISDEAEFTPKNVQTKEERVSTVYAVKITLPNQDGLLKAGMPADAVF